MKIKILLFVFIGLNVTARAQVDDNVPPKKKIVYYNNLLAGGLFGESDNGTGVAFSTTHGIRLRRWAFGAGIGYDSYFDWKTVPLFGSIEFDFAKVKKNAFFLQLNAGYADATRANREDWVSDYKEYGGPMISYMVGYKIRAEKFSLYVLAGQKSQEAHFSYSNPPWSSFAPSSKNSVEEDMGRFVVQVGFGLH